jgi:hypothetical protein
MFRGHSPGNQKKPQYRKSNQLGNKPSESIHTACLGELALRVLDDVSCEG